MKNWKSMDYLEITHYLVWAAGLVVMATALILAFENRASRNLALATGALVGGVVAFLIQARFELTSATKADHISCAYTFDLEKRELRADYSKNIDIVLASGRMPIELAAGKWLFEANPSMNEGDRKRVVSDFTLLSTVAYFGHGDRDWQRSYKSYNAPSFAFSSNTPLSKPSECAKLTEEDIRRKLRAAGNTFAGVPDKIAFTDICLPPNTTLDISSTAVILRNPILKIELTVEDPGAVSYLQPGTQTMEVPQLHDGHPRFETYVRALSIATTISSLRANHPLRTKYEEWSKTLVQRLAIWFS